VIQRPVAGSQPRRGGDGPCSHVHAPQPRFTYSREQHGLGPVRRHQRRQRHEFVAHGSHRIGFEEGIAARGHHHGIENVPRQIVPADRRADRAHDRGVGQHPGLEGERGKVGRHAVHLGLDHGGRNRVDLLDAKGVLCGHGR